MGILKEKTLGKSHKFEFGIHDNDFEPPPPLISFAQIFLKKNLGFTFTPNYPNSALFFGSLPKQKIIVFGELSYALLPLEQENLLSK